MEREEAINKADEMVVFMAGCDLNIHHLWTDLRSRFINAPASTRRSYHHCYEGGLVVHSVEVAIALIQSFEVLWGSKTDDITKKDLAKVGLFHDLGKVGDLDDDFYLPQHSEWHQRKLGQMYLLNDKILLKNHAQGSIFLLQKYNVALTVSEFQAILGHDGQYIDDNKSMKNNECGLTVLLHQADVRNVANWR